MTPPKKPRVMIHVKGNGLSYTVLRNYNSIVKDIVSDKMLHMFIGSIITLQQLASNLSNERPVLQDTSLDTFCKLELMDPIEEGGPTPVLHARTGVDVVT